MALDRSKFRATSLVKNKESEDAVNNISNRGKYERTDALKLKDGKNYIRIYPPHPGKGGEVYAEPVMRVFLPMMVDEKDKGGNVTGQKESSKPVFNARQHGGFEKDLVDEYIRLTKEKAEGLDKKEKEELLAKIMGKYAKDPNQRIAGIQYKVQYAMYANEVDVVGKVFGKFGKLEVGPAVKDGLNSAAASAEDDTNPMSVDPFSDADEGRLVVITYDSKATKPSDYYDVVIDSVSNGGRLRLFPLSDDQLEAFDKLPSLHTMYHNVFKLNDFKLQLKGLEFFDTKFNIGIFETDEFLDIAEEIKAYFDEEVATAEQQEAEPEYVDELVEQDEEIQDQFTNMSRLQLSSFSRSNPALKVKILPAMSDEEIRTALRKATEQAEPIPQEPLPGEPGYKEPAKQEVKKAATGSSMSSRLDALKNKTGK